MDRELAIWGGRILVATILISSAAMYRWAGSQPATWQAPHWATFGMVGDTTRDTFRQRMVVSIVVMLVLLLYTVAVELDSGPPRPPMPTPAAVADPAV